MISSLFSDCLENSTAHGLSHVVKGKTKFQRFIWLFCFFTASCAFLYYMTQNFIKYNAEPTSVTMNVRGTRFIPPDIHVCNTNPLSYSRIMDLAARTNSTNLENLMNHFVDIKEKLNQQDDSSAYLSTFFPSVQHDLLFRTIGHVAKQTFVEARIEKGRHFHPSTFEPLQNINYFSCFRISLGDESELENTAYQLLLHLFTDAYHLEKSTLSFYDNLLPKMDYVFGYSHFRPSGVTLIFTPPGEYPHDESHSVLLSPGRFTTIKLKMQKTISASTSKSPCYTKPKTVKYFNRLLGGNATNTYVRSIMDCKYEQLIKKLIDTGYGCNCVLHMVPVTLEMAQTYPVCHNVSTISNETNVSDLLREVMCWPQYRSNNGRFDMNECNQDKPCEVISYTTDVSSIEWPLNTEVETVINQYIVPHIQGSTMPGFEDYLKHVKENSTYLNEITKYNFARVQISAAENWSLEIYESITYGIENLISDTGGLAGLYLGMSFLTIMELIDLVYIMIYEKVRSTTERPLNQHGERI